MLEQGGRWSARAPHPQSHRKRTGTSKEQMLSMLLSETSGCEQPKITQAQSSRMFSRLSVCTLYLPEVRLDEKDRVIYSIPAIVPALHYSGDIVLPDCQVKMLKVSPRFRLQAPKAVVHLQEAACAALIQTAVEATGGICDVCHQDGGQQCVLCRFFWHKGCAKRLIRLAHPFPVFEHAWPDIFSRCELCLLCQVRDRRLH